MAAKSNDVVVRKSLEDVKEFELKLVVLEDMAETCDDGGDWPSKDGQ